MRILSNSISALNVRESQNFHVLKEIGVEEHYGDVRFNSGSGNMAISCMRNAIWPWNSSFIVDVVIGQNTTYRRMHFEFQTVFISWLFAKRFKYLGPKRLLKNYCGRKLLHLAE